MAGLSISGLVSGLNTSQIVAQLMQINQMPQQLLINEQTGEKAAVQAYQNINSKLQALVTAAKALTDPSTSAFQATTATASDPTVTTTTSSSAQTGSLTFQVTNAAQTASSISATRWSSTSATFGLTNPIPIFDSTGAQVATVQVTDPNGATPTLADAVNALNNFSYTDSAGAKHMLSAGAVQTSTGQWALQVSAQGSGSAANFTLGAAGEYNQVTKGSDATLTVGTLGSGGYQVTSATNTFTNLMPGVNVTVGQSTPLNQSVTVTVAQDVKGLTSKMQSLVDAVNAVHDEIDSDTGMNSSGAVTDASAPLSADYQVQQVYQNLLQKVGSLVTTASGSTGTAADVGITTDQYGTISFNATTFQNALQNNPTLVQGLVDGTTANPGIAQSLQTVADNASNPVTGTITQTITDENSNITSLQGSIDAWTLRLNDMQTSLTNRFNAMETALQAMQAQQQWMNSMFASSSSTPSTSSSSSSSNVTVS